MRVFLTALLGLVLATASFGQQPDIGELIYRSKDLKHLKEGCTLGYSIKDRHLFCATPSSGGSGNGATTCIDETVTTVSGETHVYTTGTIAPGLLVERCIAETIATVTGGYAVGVDGINDLYTRMTGVVGEAPDPTYWSPATGNYEDTPRRITSLHSTGQFQESTGQVHVTCLCREY